MTLDEEIEKIARAMAVADGFDPEAITISGPNDFAKQAVNFHGYDIAVRGPVWETYQRQANLFLAAQEAAKKT